MVKKLSDMVVRQSQVSQDAVAALEEEKKPLPHMLCVTNNTASSGGAKPT